MPAVVTGTASGLRCKYGAAPHGTAADIRCATCDKGGGTPGASGETAPEAAITSACCDSGGSSEIAPGAVATG